MDTETIRLSQKPAVDSIRRQAGHVLSSHAFASLYLWRKAMDLSLCITSSAFLVKGREGWFFPVGEEKEKIRLLTRLAEEEKTLCLRYATEEDTALAKELWGEGVEVIPDPASFEYLYDKEEQIAMAGKRFAYQRAKANKARRKGEILSQPLTEALLPAAETVARLWGERRPSGDPGDLEETLDALSHREALGLQGQVFSIDGQPVGFQLYSYLDDCTIDLHIAKTLGEDVDTLMKWELYRSLPSRVTTINREEDLGIPGLRLHKQDAQPAGFHRVCTLFLRP